MPHSLRTLRVLLVLFTLIVLSCQLASGETAQPATPTPLSPQATSTLAFTAPTASATPAPTLTPTPVIEVPKFAGFDTVELLPNDILLAQGPRPENILQSMSLGGEAGGGGGCGGVGDPMDFSPQIYASGQRVDVCNYPAGAELQIELVQPDGTTLQTQKKVSELDGFDRVDRFYCPNGRDLLQPSQYRLTATIGSQTASNTFEIKDFESPTVFLGRSGMVPVGGGGAGCGSLAVEGDSTEIFFAGFRPNQQVIVWLYRTSPNPDMFGFDFLTSWTAQMDEHGRLMQYIPSLELPVPTPKNDAFLFFVGNDDSIATAVSASSALYGSFDSFLNSSREVDPSLANIYVAVKSSQSVSQAATPTLTSAILPHMAPLIHIPAGEFAMGAAAGQDDLALAEERPQHLIYLSEFWMEQTEVTNARYQVCVAEGACAAPKKLDSRTRSSYHNHPGYANYPVVNVTHEQAGAYCQWAGGRLPTEAEWEKAARGAEGRLFAWGDQFPNSLLTNFNAIISDTAEVGSYPQGATPEGLLDMTGNVWEWVADWYDQGRYRKAVVATAEPGGLPKGDADPTGPASGTDRAVRGGGFMSETQFVRASNRWNRPPEAYHHAVGFRCVTTTAP